MTYRELASKNPLGSPLPPKVAHRAHASIVINQGNHDVSNITTSILQSQSIEIFHFPLRGYSQFENKIIKGGAAYERNTTIKGEEGRTWKTLYKQHKQEKNLSHYYNSQTLNKLDISKELENKSIIEDKRLVHYLKNLYK